MGAEMNSFNGVGYKDNFFKGFILSFCYKAKHIGEDDIDIGPGCGEGYCSVCPAPGCFDEETCCLIDCAWNEYLDENNTCQPCLPECLEGCIRGTNCNPCSNESCASCDAWENCSECADNASPCEDDPAECCCNEAFFLHPETGICTACDLSCANCTDFNEFCCDSCKTGFFLRPDYGICA